MKKLTLILLLFIGHQLVAQKVDAGQKQLVNDVTYLSSDKLEGRKTGSKGEDLAAAYIAKRMKKIGLEPKGTDGTWYHQFSFKEKLHPHEQTPSGIEVQSKNVVGYLDHNAPYTVIIGAHYDHLGFGGHGSLSTDSAVHNGADDNASGVGAILLLASKLKRLNLKKFNYLFIAFSGEELGLFGSKKYAENPTIFFDNVNFMINLDMVGRLDKVKGLSVFGVGTSPMWDGILKDIPKEGIGNVETLDDGIGPSDHTSFYLKDIPVLHFFTGQHSDYHKPSDDVEKVNFEGIVAISDFIIELIQRTQAKEKSVFTKTKSTRKKAASFKVTLGVMPDYMFEGPGLKIDGVLDDRPAQKAGIMKGDIITFMDDKEITDIYAYMEGLAKYKAGDNCTIKLKRGEEELEVNVIF